MLKSNGDVKKIKEGTQLFREEQDVEDSSDWEGEEWSERGIIQKLTAT